MYTFSTSPELQFLTLFRPPTLYGVPRDETLLLGAETFSELKKMFAFFIVNQSKSPEHPIDATHLFPLESTGEIANPSHLEPTWEIANPLLMEPIGVIPNTLHMEPTCEILNPSHVEPTVDIPTVEPTIDIPTVDLSNPSQPDPVVNILNQSQQDPAVDILKLPHPEPPLHSPNLSHDGLVIPEVSKGADTVSNSRERGKPVVKIRVKHSAASSKAEDVDNATVEKSLGGPSSSVSVDAPQRNFADAVSTSYQNFEEVNSCHDRESRMTASIGSAKLASEGDELGKELQCTADSSKVSSPNIEKDDGGAKMQKYASLQTLFVAKHDLASVSLVMAETYSQGKEKQKKKKKKDKEKKRKRDDPEYLERKRLKKERKQKEKEMAKASSLVELQSTEGKLQRNLVTASEMQRKESEIETGLMMASRETKSSTVELQLKQGEGQLKQGEGGVTKVIIKRMDSRCDPSEATSSSHKFRIKIKNRTLDNKSQGM